MRIFDKIFQIKDLPTNNVKKEMLSISVPASTNFDSGSGSKFSLINDNLKTVTKKRKKVNEKEREKENEEEKGMLPDFEKQVDSANRINLEEKKESVENVDNIENGENVCHDDIVFEIGRAHV